MLQLLQTNPESAACGACL